MAEKSSEPGNSVGTQQAVVPATGEPLDGRHFLDVVEEQQYAGKPFTRIEQEEEAPRLEVREETSAQAAGPGSRKKENERQGARA